MYTCLSKAHGNIMEFKYHLEIGTSLKAGGLVKYSNTNQIQQSSVAILITYPPTNIQTDVAITVIWPEAFLSGHKSKGIYHIPQQPTSWPSIVGSKILQLTTWETGQHTHTHTHSLCVRERGRQNTQPVHWVQRSEERISTAKRVCECVQVSQQMILLSWNSIMVLEFKHPGSTHLRTTWHFC